MLLLSIDRSHIVTNHITQIKSETIRGKLSIICFWTSFPEGKLLSVYCIFSHLDITIFNKTFFLLLSNLEFGRPPDNVCKILCSVCKVYAAWCKLN